MLTDNKIMHNNMNNTDKNITIIKDHLLKDDNVLFAILFGSYSKGKSGKRSDLDLAIYFKTPPEELDILDYINTLSNLANKEIDLVILNKASALLRHQALKYGTRLVIKDIQTYIRFREKSMIDYEEYKYISGMNKYVR